MYHLCDWFPWTSEVGVRLLGTGVRNGCEPLGRIWELNPGLLKEQVFFLTTEPTHQYHPSPTPIFFIKPFYFVVLTNNCHPLQLNSYSIHIFSYNGFKLLKK